ncbi:hypothetical protein MKX08_005149 [Trichoderma sp. CBMAI-0020]|nr:hypothetical protein MKX08_005149 [Trichoderma sp. CBMAI-0020]
MNTQIIWMGREPADPGTWDPTPSTCSLVDHDPWQLRWVVGSRPNTWDSGKRQVDATLPEAAPPCDRENRHCGDPKQGQSDHASNLFSIRIPI